MKIPYELFISLRYLKSKRKQTFISVITFISLAGIALGVTALIVVLAVMNGFDEDLKEKILNIKSHIIVYNAYGGGLTGYDTASEKIMSVKGVLGTSPFISAQAMISHKGDTQGVQLFGISPETVSNVMNLSKNMQKGSLQQLKDKDSIIIGCELSDKLKIKTGDELTLFVPSYTPTPFGLISKVKKLKVAGVFCSGMYEYDTSFIYIDLQKAQEIFNMKEKVTGIAVKVKDIYKTSEISREIRILDRKFWSYDWKDMNRNLFAALKLEKTVMSLILILIILVAGFNILSTLIMLVMEKNTDIGILKAMGADSSSIKKIFMLEGGIIGIAGTFLGCIGGVILCMILQKYQFVKLPSDIYYLNTLPVKMEIADIVIICAVSIVISIISTIYPARQAAKVDIVETIKYG